MINSLPLRLHCAIVILSQTNDAGASAAQSAIGETAGRIVMLEEALIAMLEGDDGAADRARELLKDELIQRSEGNRHLF